MADAFETHRKVGARIATEHATRRKDLRVGVNFDVEVFETRALARVNGRVTDLSLGGCYIDAMSVFPLGTPVLVRMSRGNEVFQAEAEVKYSKAGLGMGLAFTGLAPEQKTQLVGWAGELSANTPSVVASGTSVPSGAPQLPGKMSDPGALNLLIKILLQKGTLSHAEAEQVLREWTSSLKKP